MWYFGGRKVFSLGHVSGLEIAKAPVIGKGFDKPLKKNMVIALEPKKELKA